MMKNWIKKKIIGLGINIREFERYNEPHRFYHNWQHIEKMLFAAVEENILTDELFLAIIFHDIIYNPKLSNNEELSAELFYSYIQNEKVKQAILDTKNHVPTNEISRELCCLDLEILRSDLNTFIEFENQIFKEYQFVDYSIYKQKRIEVLKKLNAFPEFIEYVENRKPNIAVYAGSFNPFHKGHYNILEKAEKIFDKVIIARGINPSKNNEFLELPETIQFRQIEYYNGLLTDFIKNLPYEITLIRGLRNDSDFNSEITQYRYLQDLMPDIKMVSIFCDRDYEHISSSAIRFLKKYGNSKEYLI